MGKGDHQRSNKEKKKPKQAKSKSPATADTNAGKKPVVVAGKKIR